MPIGIVRNLCQQLLSIDLWLCKAWSTSLTTHLLGKLRVPLQTEGLQTHASQLPRDTRRAGRRMVAVLRKRTLRSLQARVVARLWPVPVASERCRAFVPCEALAVEAA